jgi:hypothetical protein
MSDDVKQEQIESPVNPTPIAPAPAPEETQDEWREAMQARVARLEEEVEKLHTHRRRIGL